MRIQPVAQASGHKMLRDVAMRDLPERVHAGVGAAGAMHAHLLSADRFHRGLERALHGRGVILDLPARERRAVIFDGELVAGHLDPVSVSSSAKADDPVLRGISVQSRKHGVLDTPHARSMTVFCGATALAEPHRRLHMSTQFRCHHPRKRMTQYSETSRVNFSVRGVLDTPPSRSMTVLCGATVLCGNGVMRAAPAASAACRAGNPLPSSAPC